MGYQPVHGSGARSHFLHLQFPRRLSECAGWRHPVLFIYTSSVFRNNRKFYTAAILFILLLFLGAAYAVLDLANGAGKLASLLDTFSFGSRLDLSRLAWALADQAPWFGHGSRMFTNLSTEFLPGPASPISPTMSTRRPPATTAMPGWG